MLGRYAERMGRGGFRYLLDNGIRYENAHYEHANTETVVGHASLATGTTPAHHGMVGNVWMDRDSGAARYNIEDARYHLLTFGADVDASTEIDPTQKAASVDGRSPRALLASTFADELAAGTSGAARIFAVSVKDRGAVPLAGQSGKAFWFSKKAGEFVSSNYYYEQYPAWVKDWNAAGKVSAYENTAWELMHPLASYAHAARDDQPWEVAFPGFGRTFPHAFGRGEDKYFTTFLTLSPAADHLTMEFARTLIDAESLGQDDVTDFLAVSFSSNDYVNHIFGSSSLEAEDNLLQLDRTLAALFAHVDRHVGLKHTLIVLSADHGTADVTAYRGTLGDRNVSLMDMDACLSGLEAGLVGDYLHPYLYLSRAVDGDSAQETALAVAEAVTQCPGIEAAIPMPPGTGVGQATGELLSKRVSNNYHAGRSGDIHLVFESGVYINNMEGLVIAAHHGSPWNYDTHVPVIFAGSGIKPDTVMRRITPYDIAPTLSAASGVNTPSGAVGNPLTEVLQPAD